MSVDPVEEAMATARLELALKHYMRNNVTDFAPDPYVCFVALQPKRANGIQFGLGRTCTADDWKRWSVAVRKASFECAACGGLGVRRHPYDEAHLSQCSKCRGAGYTKAEKATAPAP